jgi:hypothetical protein
MDWFNTLAKHARVDKIKGARPLILLTLWRFWRLGNDYVFDRATCDTAPLTSRIIDKANQCMLAGGKAL